MDTIAKPGAPYFDPVALREELTAIFAAESEPDHRRGRLIERLKELVRTAREAARLGLERDGNGRRCAAGLCAFQDELFRLLYDYTVTHAYRATNPSDAERIAVVATGGYGRGLLAPGSDIDILFLLPYKQTPWSESVAEHMLYVLWDLGFKVGHATRNVEQCVRLALSDFTICTALLDSRLILGEAALFEEFTRRFREDVIPTNARAFVEAKMAERDERHRRSGESRYRVEPNIKDGKGGLRDLHTLHWLAKYMTGGTSGVEAGAGGIFAPDEIVTFRKSEDFLWSVRCHLHFLTGRAEERLTFDLQPVMAERLKYRQTDAQRAVERFMKHYFLIAKDVGDLTTVLASALEMHQLKSVPRLDRLLNPMSWMTRRQVRTRTDFRIDNDRLNVAAPDTFRRDPVNLIRIFKQAEETGAFFHPAALRLIRSSLNQIDDRLRADPEANRLFLELLCSPHDPAKALRRMNETGVLGRFVPDFRNVVSMMQFNMYHHFTVDEHLIRTVGELRAIEQGALADTLPLSTAIVRSIQNRRALYVAAFLHDIGKGRIEDHSIVGARIARELCPRLGLTNAESELVAWLVEQHLTMSTIAQTRDLSDPRTVSDFAAVVQTPERLKLLLLLTVADIRAVGPGTWNGWKGQLLRQLYYDAEPIVSGGHSHISRAHRIEAAHKALAAELSDWPAPMVERFIARQYDDYWLRSDTRRQAEHARLVRSAEADGLMLATTHASDAFTAITELSVMAPNHPRLLSMFAGCCAAAGANIVGAQISTTRDGLALDTFLLQREFAIDDDEQRRASRIARTMLKVLKGEIRLSQILKGRKPPERRIAAFTVTPEVVINNALSDRLTVIEVSGRDRPGLLYELTNALSDLSLDIGSAHIATYGERAVDVFYVTDLTSKKIDAPARHAAIRERLEAVLAA